MIALTLSNYDIHFELNKMKFREKTKKVVDKCKVMHVGVKNRNFEYVMDEAWLQKVDQTSRR